MDHRNENSSFKYRFLNDINLSFLHETFNEAFSDYVIDAHLSFDQFQKHILLNAVDLDRSIGCFNGQKLVGFTLNGFGQWDGKPTVYDAGTGVVPAFRRRGISQKMFDDMFPLFKKQGFEQFLLEVVINNEKALRLYQKIGFRVTRELQVLKVKDTLKVPSTPDPKVEMREISEPDWNLLQTFWDGETSWQNSIEAVKRSYLSKNILGAFLDERCIGYIICSGTSGRIAQMAVDKNYRRKGIGSRLLSEARSNAEKGQELKVINADSRLAETNSFFRHRGFEAVLSQYEMLRTL